MILVDSNVLIDVLDGDADWHDWSMAQLEAAAEAGAVGITPVVLAEVAPRYDTLNAFMARLFAITVSVEPMTHAAAFAAGTAFRAFRRDRGERRTILADFLIGGQAAVSGASLLTRDKRLYARYFPDVPLILPEPNDD